MKPNQPIVQNDPVYHLLAILQTLKRIWYEMPESRLAIGADILAVVGIFGLAFSGRVNGDIAVAGVVIIQGSLSVLLYALAQQLEQVEDSFPSD